MHIIQQKLLSLAKERNLADLTLRKIGELIDESGSPQKIKHHLDKLIEKGLLLVGGDGKVLKVASGGFDKETKLISLPIIGSADCGEALTFADEKVEGYLKVSLGILDSQFRKKPSDLFVLRAKGESMNRANIQEKNIEEGDFILVKQDRSAPENGEYVVSVIDGMANIKKFIKDKKNNRIILMSESSLDISPIYIHDDDYSNYFVCGRVVDIIKKPDELLSTRDESARDVLKEIGPISKEDYEYYKRL
ncbi:S24 family peptidase [Patescibacteria group bacterium]|nr:S24 family peptidase [Patescibacteria group bacterium]